MIRDLPPAERVRRVAARLRRRVYHRHWQADYSNLGVDFFDETHMVRDLNLSVASFRQIYGTTRQGSQGAMPNQIALTLQRQENDNSPETTRL